jgi:hypothetical protein
MIICADIESYADVRQKLNNSNCYLFNVSAGATT